MWGLQIYRACPVGRKGDGTEESEREIGRGQLSSAVNPLKPPIFCMFIPIFRSTGKPSSPTPLIRFPWRASDGTIPPPSLLTEAFPVSFFISLLQTLVSSIHSCVSLTPVAWVCDESWGRNRTEGARKDPMSFDETYTVARTMFHKACDVL